MRLKGVLFIELCSTSVYIIRRMHTYIEALRRNLWMVYYIEYRPPLPGLYCICDLNLYCIGDRPPSLSGRPFTLPACPPCPCPLSRASLGGPVLTSLIIFINIIDIASLVGLVLVRFPDPHSGGFVLLKVSRGT